MAIDKDISNLNINQIVKELIAPIDRIRNKGIKEGFTESRCNAFYRMLGFPVVSTQGEFYNPGYSVGVNLDSEIKDKHTKINKAMIANKKFCSQQLDPRERIFKDFSNLFSSGGFNATAISLGSMYVRSFERQFGSTSPFEYDSTQIQSVGQRENEIKDFYNNDSELESYNQLLSSRYLFSTHILKPFVVDSRIDSGNEDNLISAPFPINASEIRKFDKSFYPRPYIERVISVRFSSENVKNKAPIISEIIANIKKDETVIDSYLISVASNPEKQMQNSDIVVFGSYLKLLRSLINSLVYSVKDISKIKKAINFKPIPDKLRGLEGSIKLDSIEPTDIHNKDLENKIIELYTKQSLRELSRLSGELDSKSDNGGFVFSGLDDMVFSSDKARQVSEEKNLSSIIRLREQAAAAAFEELRNIEYIMGEFSGLGLIDIVAIQSAFWLMDKDKLVGFLDDEAYIRAVIRDNISVAGSGRVENIETCLSHYEEKLKQVYLVIQLHFDQVWNGKAFNPS